MARPAPRRAQPAAAPTRRSLPRRAPVVAAALPDIDATTVRAQSAARRRAIVRARTPARGPDAGAPQRAPGGARRPCRGPSSASVVDPGQTRPWPPHSWGRPSRPALQPPTTHFPTPFSQAAYWAIGAGGVSFVGTFGVAPLFKKSFKEDVDWQVRAQGHGRFAALPHLHHGALCPPSRRLPAISCLPARLPAISIAARRAPNGPLPRPSLLRLSSGS